MSINKTFFLYCTFLPIKCHVAQFVTMVQKTPRRSKTDTQSTAYIFLMAFSLFSSLFHILLIKCALQYCNLQINYYYYSFTTLLLEGFLVKTCLIANIKYQNFQKNITNKYFLRMKHQKFKVLFNYEFIIKFKSFFGFANCVTMALNQVESFLGFFENSRQFNLGLAEIKILNRMCLCYTSLESLREMRTLMGLVLWSLFHLENSVL